MDKNSAKKKLALDKDTVRVLSTEELKHVVGGNNEDPPTDTKKAPQK